MKLRKVLSLFVALVMMFEVLPLSSLATEIADATENVEVSAEAVEEETVEEAVEEESAVLLGATADESGIATASEDNSIIASGECGTLLYDLTWTLTSDGTLIISGIGEMKDYEYHSGAINTPWYSYREIIKKAIIEDGVTYIGNSAFWRLTNLTSVVIADSVTAIGNFVFRECSSLTKLSIPDSVVSLGYRVFYDSGLKTINYPLSLEECTPHTQAGGITTYYFYGSFIGCDLDSIYVPVGVTYIPDYCFDDSSISDVYFAGTEEEWNEITIGRYNSALYNATIHYLSGIDISNLTTIPSFFTEEDSISVGSTDVLAAYWGIVFGEDSEELTITIESSDPSVIEITSDTETPYTHTAGDSEWEVCEIYVNALSVGTADIILTTSDGYTTSVTIKVVDESGVGTDNTLIAGKDWWSFANSSGPFALHGFLFSDDSYYITDEDFAKLIEKAGDDNTTIERLQNCRESEWKGSCMGMSVIVCLLKMGGLDIDDIPYEADYLYDVELTDSVESYINYYQFLAETTEYKDVSSDYYNTNEYIYDELMEIIEMAENVSSGGSPVYLDFAYVHLDKNDDRNFIKKDKDGVNTVTAHAIVVYDVEYGSYTWYDYEYDVCLVTYDPNYPDGTSDNSQYIYVDSSNGKWIIPYIAENYLNGNAFSSWSYCTDDDGNTRMTINAWIQFATNNIQEVFDSIDGDSDDAYLWINSGADLVLVSGDLILTVGLDGDLKIIYDTSATLDSDTWNTSGAVILPDSESSYTIYPSDSVTEVSYMLEYNDSLLIVEGTSVDTIEITQTSVSVSGTDSDVSLGLVSNDGYYVTPWYKAELSAEDVDDLSLSMSDTGYVVEGTDLSDITVYGTNDYETVELTFSTDKDKALVTEDSAENMIVLIDEDNNGTYETVIATTDYAGLVEEAKATLSSADWTLTQSDVESATGSTTADKISTLIDAILTGLGIDDSVTVTYTITDITEAIAGDATDVDGTDGSFTINFTISAGNESDTLTETGTITATAYVHTHSLTRVEAVDATCTAEGNTEYWYCSGCDKYYSDENAENEITLADTVTAKIAHNYEAVVTEPTCTEGGYTTYTCSVCKDSYVADETAALGHDYEAVVTEPTCTEGGYTTYTCSVCKDSYVADEVEATGHNYEAVVTEPTCTEGGYTTYTCSVCKDSYVADEVEATGHNYEAVVTEPTCTEGGYTTYTCSVCKDSYVADEVEATGHNYEAVVTEPTCTEGGYTTYTCSVCKDSYVADETAALGHDYTSEVTKEATCTEAGVMTYTCTRGDDSYTVEIPATGHTEAEAVVENEVAATCTTDGSYDSVVYCSICHEELSRETIVVPAAHTAGTAVRENVVEATRTTEGSYDLVTYCTVCGEEISRETVTVPATGVDMITVWLRTPADYSAVNNAIAKANALNSDDYTNFSDVTDAINAVNWTYNALMQSYVNEMAEKIETAIANLIPVGTTTEEVEIQEPIEDTNTDTEDDDEESSEPSEAETNPTTGIAFSILPMMIAVFAAVSAKRK